MRQGNDLHYRATISLLEALTGSVLKIKHLDGHIVTVTRDTVTKPGMSSACLTCEQFALCVGGGIATVGGMVYCSGWIDEY